MFTMCLQKYSTLSERSVCVMDIGSVLLTSCLLFKEDKLFILKLISECTFLQNCAHQPEISYKFVLYLTRHKQIVVC